MLLPSPFLGRGKAPRGFRTLKFKDKAQKDDLQRSSFFVPRGGGVEACQKTHIKVGGREGWRRVYVGREGIAKEGRAWRLREYRLMIVSTAPSVGQDLKFVKESIFRAMRFRLIVCLVILNRAEHAG